MSKTPISMLQELMVKRKEKLPEYIIEGAETRFKCIVIAGGLVAEGEGQTKKDAKQNSALAALKKFGFSVSSYNKPQTVVAQSKLNTVNYVGNLNEYSITYKKYPEYEDSGIPIDGQFVVTCTFMTHKTMGRALTKKDAKQESAKNMLELLKKTNQRAFLLGETTVKEKLLLNDKLYDKEEILQKYEELTQGFKNATINNENCNTVRPVQEPTKIKSVEDLSEVMDQMDLKFTIETIQKQPYILSFTVAESNCILLGYGPTREEAWTNIFKHVEFMIDNRLRFKI